MKQQIFKTIICSALLVILAACGKDKDSGQANIAPPPDIQQKADSILNSDAAFKMSAFAGSSNMVRKDVKGVGISVNDVLTGGKASGNIMLASSIVEMKGQACPTTVRVSAITPIAELVDSWVNIQDMGRVRCLDKACHYLLMVLQLKRTVVSGNPDAHGASSVQTSAVPVIMFESTDGKYIPTNSTLTGSPRAAQYLVASDINGGRQNCSEAQKTAQLQGTAVNPGAGVNATGAYTPTIVTNNGIGYR